MTMGILTSGVTGVWRDDGVLVSKDQVSVFVACYV